jgi:hypothetical protein
MAMSDQVDKLLDGMVRDGAISDYERRNTRQMVVTRDGQPTALSMRILTQLVAQDDTEARNWVSAETKRLGSESS